MEEPKRATFLVTKADEESAILRDVETAQIHTLSSNPGLSVHDAVEATVSPDPPMGVTWSVDEVHDTRSLSVERSDEPPTTFATDIAADQEVGDLSRQERAGIGEIHVVSVPEGETERAVEDVLTDEETLARAARLAGVVRVEIRAEDGVVSIRYLP